MHFIGIERWLLAFVWTTYSSPVSPRQGSPVPRELLPPTSDVASRQRLRSSSRHHLVVPRHRRSTFGRRAFSVAGPMAWNALPDDLRDPSLSAEEEEAEDASVSECTWTRSALEALRNALYKFKTYLLTCQIVVHSVGWSWQECCGYPQLCIHAVWEPHAVGVLNLRKPVSFGIDRD